MQVLWIKKMEKSVDVHSNGLHKLEPAINTIAKIKASD